MIKIIFLVALALAIILILGVQPKQHVISYNGENFTPSSLTITLGERVTVKNDSSKYMELAVGEHQSHRNLAGFEEKVLEAGEIYTFTPQEKGKFNFHDHLNPKQLGQLVIF